MSIRLDPGVKTFGCLERSFIMDPELEQALLQRRLISGDVQPTGAASLSAGSGNPAEDPLALAALQIHSNLIGATQALGSKAKGGVDFFVGQVQEIVRRQPQVVEALRIEGINLSDKIERLKQLDQAGEQPASAETTPSKPSARAEKPSSKKTAAKSSATATPSRQASKPVKTVSKTRSAATGAAKSGGNELEKTSLPSGAVISGSGSENLLGEPSLPSGAEISGSGSENLADKTKLPSSFAAEASKVPSVNLLSEAEAEEQDPLQESDGHQISKDLTNLMDQASEDDEGDQDHDQEMPGLAPNDDQEDDLQGRGEIDDTDDDEDDEGDDSACALEALEALSQKIAQGNTDNFRDDGGEAQPKARKGKGKEKAETPLNADFFKDFKTGMMSEISVMLSSGFGTVSKAAGSLKKATENNTKAVKATGKKVENLEIKINGIDQRLLDTETKLTELQSAFEKAQTESESLRKTTAQMQEEIQLLKDKYMLLEAKGPATSGPGHSSASGIGGGGARFANDRDRFIVGKWPWIPARAAKKQLYELVEQFNKETQSVDKLMIDSYESSMPKASYCFIKFVAVGGRSASDQGHSFRIWLRQNGVIAAGSDSQKLWTNVCRPEHERANRSLLNQARAFLHTKREKELNMDKEYDWLGELTQVVGGSYKEGEESITWKETVIATVTNPEGVKCVTWAWDSLCKTMKAEYEAVRKCFDLDAFKRDWKDFQEENEKEKARRS